MALLGGGLLIGAALAAASGAATTADRPVAVAFLSFMQTPPDGGELYARQCAPCHGAEGGGGVGSSVTDPLLPKAERLRVITEGERGMPAFDVTLSEAEIAAISDFIDTLAGGAIFVEQCASCHGPNGEGGVGPSLLASTLSADERRQVITEGRPGMPAWGNALTAEQIDALVLVVGQMGQTGLGSQLYAQQCSPCHGAAGEGGAGPPLPSGLSGAEVRSIVENGIGSMPAFGSTLTAGEIDEIIAFAQDLGGPQEQETTTTQQVVEDGAQLYADLCAACHGPGAEGGTGPSLIGTGMSTDAITQAITTGRGSMPGFGATLSPDDMDAIAGFVMALDAGGATTTRAEPEASGAELFILDCAQCHAPDGSGGLGPRLVNIQLSLNEIISIIYGGHAGGMPAFEGALTGLQVQAVARFVQSLRSESGGGGSGWIVWAISLASVLVVLSVGGWMAGRRSRRSQTEEVPAGVEGRADRP